MTIRGEFKKVAVVGGAHQEWGRGASTKLLDKSCHFLFCGDFDHKCQWEVVFDLGVCPKTNNFFKCCPLLHILSIMTCTYKSITDRQTIHPTDIGKLHTSNKYCVTSKRLPCLGLLQKKMEKQLVLNIAGFITQPLNSSLS